MKQHYRKIPLEALQDLALINVDPLRLYLVLCYHADFTTGVCWPSYKTIMQMTKISKNTRIKKAIDFLIECGFIDSWLEDGRRKYRIL